MVLVIYRIAYGYQPPHKIALSYPVKFRYFGLRETHQYCLLTSVRYKNGGTNMPFFLLQYDRFQGP